MQKALFEGLAHGDPNREHVTLFSTGKLVPLVNSPPYRGRIGDVVDVEVRYEVCQEFRRPVAKLAGKARKISEAF